MPYRIETSEFSFVQFDDSDIIEVCGWTPTDMCLPVYQADDHWFQFVVVADSEEEADALCGDSSLIRVGLVESCSDGYLLEFANKPVRYRISPMRVRYDWMHGFPNFQNFLNVGECFRVKLFVANQAFCSNCFQRIGDDCYTSVVQYGNEDNFAGFSYCAGPTGSEQEDNSCEPLEIPFTNQATMIIPWTAYLSNKYGNTPSIEVWVYDENGDLIKPGVVSKLIGYPPSQIEIDFGGISSGVVKIM